MAYLWERPHTLSDRELDGWGNPATPVHAALSTAASALGARSTEPSPPVETVVKAVPDGR